MLFGVDGADGGLSVTVVESDEALHLLLRVAHQAGADLNLVGPRRQFHQQERGQDQRYNACCECHGSLHCVPHRIQSGDPSDPGFDYDEEDAEFSFARNLGLVAVAAETRARAHEIAQRPNWIDARSA